MNPLMSTFITACHDAIGAQYVLTGDDTAPFLSDQRRRFTGKALAVVKPGSTVEVATIVKLCNTHQTAIVPQSSSEERRDGKVGVSTCSSRWWTYNKKKKKNKIM